jgi:hypothetical protein
MYTTEIVKKVLHQSEHYSPSAANIYTLQRHHKAYKTNFPDGKKKRRESKTSISNN